MVPETGRYMYMVVSIEGPAESRHAFPKILLEGIRTW